ncbi:(deoxy)nucleoside triphosphate pyrophosphohydrolase [Chitinophaga japonensis]|uniref:8-oxo-dGTP diphosphatase n=1 Tax=Chitinophaga japonensis TaxID=104662 RepID=A0A562SYR2_CHIJA|nr:(deoxy)nucleoside triphosphate pyrophosphohydrolase [Chitinophaga japonensis]TWI86465.1 8-oxo-dGTP diphosphatase/(d)CTP diphosphatase [Chitinophaga japonensis]
MDIIKVVCGIIFKEDKIFICRRKQHKSLGGYWEFPGGKVEDGENEEDSLSRELHEELGMKVKIDTHFKTVVHSYDNFTIELISYICQFREANYNLTDHDAYEWVLSDDLHKKNLAPADIPIANALVNFNLSSIPPPPTTPKKK